MLKQALLGLIVGLLVTTIAGFAVQVDGYCYLEGQSNHAGTRVLFEASSPVSVTDSAFTDATGYYRAHLNPGAYDVQLFHHGYSTAHIGEWLISTAMTLPDVILFDVPDGIYISGELSGVMEDTIYIVEGDIRVNSNASLTIEPGAIFYFLGDSSNTYDFIIEGIINAVGTETDTIKFMPAPGTPGWEGINVITPSGVCRLEYCYVTGVLDQPAIRIWNGLPGNLDMIINHCTVVENSSPSLLGAITVDYVDVLITNCDVSRNIGNGICVRWLSPTTISKCVITENTEAGIYCVDADYPDINYCVVNLNGQDGIKILSCNNAPRISHCTVSENFVYGINIGSSQPVIDNTIVYGGDYMGINFGNNSQGTTVSYCDFYDNEWGNFRGIPPNFLGTVVSTNLNGDSCDVYFNIYEDPRFVNPEEGDYRLTPLSACIDAGDPTYPLDPDSTITDIGAYYFPHNAASIALTTGILNFGSVSVGEQAELPLTICSVGNLTLVLFDIFTSNPSFSTNWDPADSLIASGDSLEIMVYFSPVDTMLYDEIMAIENNAEFVEVELHGVAEGYVTAGPTPSSNIPGTFALYEPYPNPFNPTTTLEFAVPAGARVNLVVYDVMGRKVATLVDGWRDVGTQKAVFDGSGLASGIYFARMQAGDFHQVQKMVLLK